MTIFFSPLDGLLADGTPAGAIPLTPDSYAWLRQRVSACKSQVAAGMTVLNWDRMERAFQAVHSCAVKTFGSESLVQSCQNPSGRDYLAPVYQPDLRAKKDEFRAAFLELTVRLQNGQVFHIVDRPSAGQEDQLSLDDFYLLVDIVTIFPGSIVTNLTKRSAV